MNVFINGYEYQKTVFDCTGYRIDNDEIKMNSQDLRTIADLIERDPKRAFAIVTQLSGRYKGN